MIFRVVVLGGAGAGKTVLVKRLAKNVYAVAMPSGSIKITPVDHTHAVTKKRHVYNLWDFPSGDPCLEVLMRGADAALVVYNVPDPASLAEAVARIAQVRGQVSNVPVLLCGTKLDLADANALAAAEASLGPIRTANQYTKFRDVKVSSATGANISQVMEELSGLV